MRRRFTEEQTIGILRAAHRCAEAAASVKEITRRHGISAQSYYLYERLSRCKMISI